MIRDKHYLTIKESFNINSKNNRFILKLFGELNHEHINIEKDEILTISKTKIDNFEKKGQISKWVFSLDQIYSNDTTFDELYENEIENNDYLHEFSKESKYRTLTFIGDRNDNLIEEPYRGFILKCVKECLNGIEIQKTNNSNENEDILIPIVSFCEMNKMYALDYLKNISDINNIENKEKQCTLINSPKINYYEDDIIIDGINQVQISNEKEFISLLNLGKKNVDFYKFNKSSIISQDESIAQIITLKLIKSSSNECFSKINFLLYKAYEILDETQSEINDNLIVIPDNSINKSSKIKIKNHNKNTKNKNRNNIYNLYTKDNYAFFRGVQNKINFRISYILKYIKDTLIKGINLYIVLLPCEYQYLLLIHDLLDNINMRKLIVENIIIDDEDQKEQEQTNISNKALGEYFKFENISELNDNENDENLIKEENDAFQSFSKNNSVNTNINSGFCNDTFKSKNFLYNSCISNEFTQTKNKRIELNVERLKKITDKTNIINLFEILDKLTVNEDYFNN